nr:hypothetical protein [Tanacetum cinerariifolium]
PPRAGFIDLEDPDAATKPSGTSSTIEKSPLDFNNENPSQQITEGKGTEGQAQETVAPKIPPPGNVSATRAIPEVGVKKEIAVMGPPLSKKRRKRGKNRDVENAPPKMLRKDHSASRSTQITIGGKSLASTGLEAGSTFFAPAPQETPVDVRDPDPLSYATPPSIPERDIAQPYFPFVINADLPIERPSWEIQILRSLSPSPPLLGRQAIYISWGGGVTNDCLMETSTACQDMVDHIVPPGLRFEQEVRLRKRTVKRIAKQEQRIQVREDEIKKLDQKVQAKAKNANLTKELESLHTQFSDLRVNNHQLSQQVSDLQTQVTGEERIKAAFEEFKKYEDERVNSWSAEMDARLDALSIDFNEELYPHMLTVIAGRQWVIRHGLRLAVMKCGESPELRQAFVNVVSAGLVKGMSEGLAHGIEHEKASQDLEVMEAYDPEANSKYLQALQELKDLKYPIVDQLEGLNDAPMEVIMASLHLESDSEDDAPKWIRDLRPSTSQLKILVYPKVRDPRNPWAVKGEMLLEDAIAANMSRAEKNKKCRVVCRSHGVGFAHYVRSDGVPVWVPTIAPQGLAILLADAAT